MTEISAELLRDEEYSEWGKLVSNSPDGSIYATPEYLDTLCIATGARFRILGVRKGKDLVAGLPLYETKGTGGRVVGPRLLLYYLGPVVRRYESKYPSQQTARTIQALTALEQALATLGYAKILLKGRHTVSDVRPFLQQGWRAWPSYSYVVPLTDMPAQWERVDQNLRRLVDRSRQASMSVTEDDDFNTFFALHQLTMAHHGAQPYLPAPQFAQWFRSLHRNGMARLFQVRLPTGEAIGGQMVLLGDHPVSHTVCAVTHPTHRSLGASAFLRWSVFEWLASNGKAANDLTDAALNPVTHFKSQLGGQLVTNLVVENRGSSAWRAANGVKSGYRTARSGVGALARGLRRRASE